MGNAPGFKPSGVVTVFYARWKWVENAQMTQKTLVEEGEEISISRQQIIKKNLEMWGEEEEEEGEGTEDQEESAEPRSDLTDQSKDSKNDDASATEEIGNATTNKELGPPPTWMKEEEKGEVEGNGSMDTSTTVRNRKVGAGVGGGGGVYSAPSVDFATPPSAASKKPKREIHMM